MLRLSYQLKDSAGRAQVDPTDLIIRASLSYAESITPPAGAQAADNALPDCDVSTLGAASGVGDCSVAVDRKFFPSTGMLAAKVDVKVLLG